MSYQPIENYGIIGNMHTIALAGMNGSIDFMCYPYFDSPSIFAAMLDHEKGGRFQLHAVLEDAREMARIVEEHEGPKSPTLAKWLDSVAQLLFHQNRWEEAKPLIERALEIREQVLGPEHPETAESLNNLGVLLKNQGKCRGFIRQCRR